ncbi:YbdD/YjiX family protein [Mycetocola sp. BIGb0189]|uniref:YbdD/YjiX family protein n=1 Tax=Mycetocola sp. BIGb0189 TaxID=2940604 RepID=UPI0021697B7C|nr:YbdD/YjiX family protein [Mycetocola sp. BIGb0189]
MLAARTSRALAPLARIYRFLGSMMGEDAYRVFVTHQRLNHPGRPVPSARDFWRDHYARQDTNPGARCC